MHIGKAICGRPRVAFWWGAHVRPRGCGGGHARRAVFAGGISRPAALCSGAGGGRGLRGLGAFLRAEHLISGAHMCAPQKARAPRRLAQSAAAAPCAPTEAATQQRPSARRGCGAGVRSVGGRRVPSSWGRPPRGAGTGVKRPRRADASTAPPAAVPRRPPLGGAVQLCGRVAAAFV